MKRENLFRGKLNLGGEWIFGLPSYDFQYIFNDGNLDSPDRFEVNPKTIGQLLFKINGHRFFEGDIIGREESNAKYVILWNEENQCFSTFNCYDLKNINEDDELLRLNTLCNMEQVRVSFLKKYNFYPVGNIFDNPEIMDVEN